MNNKIWFTSDTHFTSESTMHTSKRPFKTVSEMDEIIINNWNSIVGKDDMVYHLGDFGNYDILRKLNGKITLIMGGYEHEDAKKDFNGDVEKWCDHISQKYGIIVLSNPHHMVSISIETCVGGIIALDLYMSHKLPSLNKRMMVAGDFNLFGMYHKLAMIKRNALNVGVDCHNFKPISIKDILFYRNFCNHLYDNDGLFEE